MSKRSSSPAVASNLLAALLAGDAHVNIMASTTTAKAPKKAAASLFDISHITGTPSWSPHSG